MKCGIYKITNKINGHAYIGQSVNITRRWTDHKNRYKDLNYDSTLYKAFRKYGLENFSFEILEECEPELLDEREIYYVALYDTFNDGYNETLGGNNSCSSSIEPEYVEQVRYDLANTNLMGIEISQKYNISDQTVSDINVGRMWRKSSIEYPIRKQPTKEERQICPVCGGHKTPEAAMCIKCSNQARATVKRPPSNELAEKIYYTSFSAVGREFGVTGKAIAKWCKSYGIPHTIKELRQWYEEQNGIVKSVAEPKPKVERPVKTVLQLDPKTQEVIATYANLHEAGRALGDEEYRKHIGDVCNGYRKTAYGYCWKYKE